MNKWTNFIH